MARDWRPFAGIESWTGVLKFECEVEEVPIMIDAPEIIDDLRHAWPMAVSGNGWALISDRVMGGGSAGTMRREVVDGREAIRMKGAVSLENNGGFLQVALDLGDAGGEVDARRWTGVKLDVFGNDQVYNLHLRTSDIRRPWESYRKSFEASNRWTTVFLPFNDFLPHRSERPLNLARLRRIGIVAIGREFEADVSIADIRFYADAGEEALEPAPSLS
jgi:hypothetical protein